VEGEIKQKRMKGEDVELASLLLGRSFVSAGFALVTIASPEILLQINAGDHAAASVVSARIETLTTITGFLSRAAIGNFIDSYGRLPALVLGPLISAFARFLVVLYPSNTTYTVYRVANLVSMIPLMQAFSASLADRFGRGSDEFSRINRRMWGFLAVVRLLMLNFARNHRLELRTSFAIAATANLCASLVFAGLVRETLKDEDKRPFNPRNAGNPFSFVSFFSKSRVLMNFALLNVMVSIPTYNGTLSMYRSQKFHWKMRENAQQQQLINMVEILSPFISIPLMEWLGRRKTAIARQYAFALANLNTAFSPDGSSLRLNPIISAIFDEEAMEVLTARAKNEIRAGEGQIASATMNMKFPLGLILPTLFSSLFITSTKWKSRMSGTAPFLACAFLQLINAAFIIPNLWDDILSEKQTENNSKMKTS